MALALVYAIAAAILLGSSVVVDLARGDRPSGLGAAGMGVGLTALALTSCHPGGTGSVSLGAVLGIASGVVWVSR